MRSCHSRRRKLREPRPGLIQVTELLESAPFQEALKVQWVEPIKVEAQATLPLRSNAVRLRVSSEEVVVWLYQLARLHPEGSLALRPASFWLHDLVKGRDTISRTLIRRLSAT